MHPSATPPPAQAAQTDSARPGRGGDLQALRAQNRVAVLDLLRAHPDGASVSTIHDGTSLSRPTVNLAVADLIEAGLAVEGTLGTSTNRGGRPGRRYRLDPRVGVVAGAAIGLERVDVMLGDTYGNVLARSSLPRRDDEPFRDQIIAGLHALQLERDPAPPPIRSITVGVIGIVAPGEGIRRNEGLAEIAAPDYFTPIGTEFSCRVLIENDANLAATAEFTHLARTDVSDMVALHADVAVGCGLIVGDRLHRGRAGAAGELGFYPQLGWKDSHEALQHTAREHGMTVAELFATSGEGTAWAVSAVRDFAHAVAPGVLAIVLTLNPQTVVISGEISTAGDAFREPLRSWVTERAPDSPEFLLSELGRECIVLGALDRSRQALWSDLVGRAYAGR